MPRSVRVHRILALCCLAVALTVPVLAQKKPPKDEPTPWPCQLTLRDAVDEFGNPVDAIQSDGQGSYINGQDGGRVRCHIVQAPINAHDGWLSVWIDAGSTRYVNFPAQTAYAGYTKNGYNTFQNRGSFEVKYIRDATIVGQTYLKAFRAYVNDPQFGRDTGEIGGDSFAGVPESWQPELRGTSSVFVVPLDDCTWQITSNPSYPLTEGEGASSPRVARLTERGRGGKFVKAADFVFPFSATARIIGGKPGCGPQ